MANKIMACLIMHSFLDLINMTAFTTWHHSKQFNSLNPQNNLIYPGHGAPARLGIALDLAAYLI